MRRTDLFCNRRQLVTCGVAVWGVLSCLASLGAEPPAGRQLTEPVHRVARVDDRPVAEQHPLDPALTLAREGLANIRENVRDYTCILVKRERINGEWPDHYEYMSAKIRSEQRVNGRVVVPFSVYLKFLSPPEIKGREVLYVRGRNEDKLFAHEGGTGMLSRFPSQWLDPIGYFAMKGNRYPITEIGIETLIMRLIEKGERDRKRGECEVNFYENARINGRKCTRLVVRHPHPRPYFDFHIAEIFIDDELNVPIRYAAYSWPEQPGGAPVPIEEYTYTRMKLNVGLTDRDFDPKNPDYNF